MAEEKGIDQADRGPWKLLCVRATFFLFNVGTVDEWSLTFATKKFHERYVRPCALQKLKEILKSLPFYWLGN